MNRPHANANANAQLRLGLPGFENIDGHNIAVQVNEVTHALDRGVPIYEVRVGMLAGQVDEPRLIFGTALLAAYSYVLQDTHQQPHAEDTAQLQFFHPDITSRDGSFCTENVPIAPSGITLTLTLTLNLTICFFL